MEIKGILKPLLRGLPIIILSMIIGFLISKKYLGYVTPMYESTAKLKLADISEGIPNENLFKDFDVFASANKIAGEIEVLKSSDLILSALSELDFNLEIFRVGSIRSVELYHQSPLTIKLLNGSGKAYDNRFKLKVISLKQFEIYNAKNEKLLEAKFNEVQNFLDNKIIISLNDSLIKSKIGIKIIDLYEFEFYSSQRLIEKINNNLDIIAVDKDVPVIRINYKSNIPEKAKLFVNQLAQTYITDYIDSKYKAANITVKFLDDQIKSASERLAKSENQIEDFRNSKSIINIKQETETDLKKLSELKIQQGNLKMNLEAIEELNRYIEFGKDQFLTLAPNFEAFTDLLSTEIVKTIKKLQAEKKDLMLVYTENDDKVKIIDSKINDLVLYLIESIKNTKINLRIKYNELNKVIEESEKKFIGLPQKEKNMNILNRDFDLLQSSYNFLNEKRIEAEIAQSAKISFHKVISKGELSKQPISPNRPIIIILSVLLSLIISIVGIYTVHFLKAKVNDQSNLEKTSTIPLAISVPYIKKDEDLAFKRIVLELQLKRIIAKSEVISFSSFNLNEGRSYNILNIAKALLSQSYRVLLIDIQGDINPLAIQTVLNQYQNNGSRLTFYDFSKYKHELFNEEKMMSDFQIFKTKYDVVLINNECLHNAALSVLIMKYADKNVIVLDSRNTPLLALQTTEKIKNEFLIENTYFLLNRSNYNPNIFKSLIKLFVSAIKTIHNAKNN